MKIHPVEAELYADRRTDGQRDRTKLIFDIRNFANALKNDRLSSKDCFYFPKVSSHEVTTGSNHGMLIDAKD
jgi:hypothetical protein